MTDQPWYMKNYKEQFSAKSNQRLLPRIEAALAIEQAERNAKRDTVHLHPSEMSKDNWCVRSSYYKITGVDESDSRSFNLKSMNIFAEGHNIHDKWQRWMWKAGGLVGNWKCSICSHRWEDTSPERCPTCLTEDIRYAEVPIEDPRHRIIGHADGIWEDADGRAVIEIKSVGLGTIRWDAPKLYEGYDSGDLSLDELWKRIKRPLTTHRRQVNLYMHCLGIDKAVVIYEWKPSQDVKEFQLNFEPELVEPMLEGAKQVIDALDDNLVPIRPDFATHKSCAACRFCSYKTHCWSSDNG